MNRASEFRMGLVTDGAGSALEDPAVAYADFDDCEYSLELRGDDAFDLLTEILRAASAAEDLLAALKAALPVLLVADDTKLPRLQERIEMIEAAIAKAEA